MMKPLALALAALVFATPAIADLNQKAVGYAPLASSGKCYVSYQGYASSTSDLTTYTFSSFYIGPPRADRVVVAAFHGIAGVTTRSITSATIGGSAATEIAKTNADLSTTNSVASGIYTRTIATGEATDITVTFSAGFTEAAVDVYVLSGTCNLFSAVTANTLGANTIFSSDTAVQTKGAQVRVGSVITNNAADITGCGAQGADAVVSSNAGETAKIRHCAAILDTASNNPASNSSNTMNVTGGGATAAGAYASASWGAQSSITLAYQTNTTSTVASITAPASINYGDLLILVDYGVNTAGAPTNVTPAGFTQLGTNNAGNARASVSYRIADGAEDSVAYTGINGTSSNQKVMLQYRGDKPIAAVNQATAAPQGCVATNPAVKTVSVGANAKAPTLGISVFASQTAVDPRTTSITPDHEITPSTLLYVQDFIQATTPATYTVDMDDEGTGNCLGGYGLMAFVP